MTEHRRDSNDIVVRAAVGVFCVTLFFSALLLFQLQPMIAKAILPLLGGTPQVWTACMLFFQAALLAGYGYAYLLTRFLKWKAQAPVHLGIVLCGLLFLPLGLPADLDAPAGNPVSWILTLLLLTVGLPFAVISATAPLLQRWFSYSGYHRSKDPYFLYAASNLGSLVALLSYPFIWERLFPLTTQMRLWSWSYLFLSLLLGACALLGWHAGRGVDSRRWAFKRVSVSTADPTALPEESLLTAGSRLRWVALAFVPSSLMLGVTTYISTDLAVVPLIWIVPLALYLISFIVVFSGRWRIVPKAAAVAFPYSVVLLALMFAGGAVGPIWFYGASHLVAFFAIALICHAELAARRPSILHLTEFYFLISLGGVLGGAFNAVVAPALFHSVAEYPLVLVLACFCRPGRLARSFKEWMVDLGLVTAIALLVVASFRLADLELFEGRETLGLLAVPALLCFVFQESRIRFALCTGAFIFAGFLSLNPAGQTIFQERNFFGVSRVAVDRDQDQIRLVHGTTLHGIQSRKDSLERVPLSYYHPSGPIGQIFDARQDLGLSRVAVIGLGIGSMASYAEPDQMWHYYEIDPIVISLATNPQYFTFLSSSASPYEIFLGDGRLSLARAEEEYDLIVLDAFSSDAIPVHLLTQQAVELYLDRLAGGGWIAFHISNRHLDLEPMLGTLAHALGLTALTQFHLPSDSDAADGATTSRWVVLSREPFSMEALASDPRWAEPRSWPNPGLAWTDQYSNILTVLR